MGYFDHFFSYLALIRAWVKSHSVETAQNTANNCGTLDRPACPFGKKQQT